MAALAGALTAAAGGLVAPGDRALLQRAAQLLQANQLEAAEAALAALTTPARAHPDALYLAAIAADKGGRQADALGLFERALQRAPNNAGIWTSHGNLLNRRGDRAGAMASYRRAVAAVPGHLEAWLNLGIVALGAALRDTAAEALDRARSLDPRDARVLGAIGLVAQGRGDPAAAVAAYEAALAVNPRDVRVLHNLATALRKLGATGPALVAIEGAIASGATAPESASVRAHLLADLGRFDEAVAQYRAVIASAPGHLDAQETLAALLPQIGRGGEALDGFAAALAAGAAPALWLAAINAARGLGDAATMLRWAEAAVAAHGPHPDWTVARISALTLAGDSDRALAAAEAADENLPAVRNYLAFLHLKTGDIAQAKAHAEAATRMAPDNQNAWALLTIIWRLTGDPREQWLADYDRLVMVADLIVPPGWRDLAAFMADLHETLTRLHVTRLAPAEQSLRGGTQTRGTLFETGDPVLMALEASLVATVETCLAGLAPDSGHPFLGRLTGCIEMAGSWSVRLASRGFHISHIHPSGWLSSAFYVGVPAEIVEGDTRGALLFGVPDAALGIDLPPRRVVTPKVGRLVIFPSYFWHGTGAFESDAVRMSVAFDALPRRSAA